MATLVDVLGKDELRGTGWLPDYPSIGDLTVESDGVPTRAKQVGEQYSVNSMLSTVGVLKAKKAAPKSVDLRHWFSPIEDQGHLGSCTAQAGVGLVEYFERRAFGRHLDASRLFLYKTTRNLLHWTGDTGAFIRTTMGAMALFGVPPEEHCPYDVAKFDEEPSQFLYAMGSSFRALQYYRLDSPPGAAAPEELLQRIKTCLAAGLPSMFGFTCYSSLRLTAQTGEIPYPEPRESVIGGHAMIVVGYDDTKSITNPAPGSQPTRGAFRVRNSWGTGWGDEGYGWLPYEYVRSSIAVDWWSLLKNEWIDSQQFGQ